MAMKIANAPAVETSSVVEVNPLSGSSSSVSNTSSTPSKKLPVTNAVHPPKNSIVAAIKPKINVAVLTPVAVDARLICVDGETVGG